MLTSAPGPGRERTCAANTAVPFSTPVTLTSTVRRMRSGVGLGQRADGPEQAGVVHPEVDAPVSSHDRRREGVQGGAVGHVDGGGDRRLGGLDVAVLRRGPGAGGQDGAVAGAQAQVHPRRGEVDGQAGAQAPAGARHDGDPAADRRRHQAVWRTDRSRRYVAAALDQRVEGALVPLLLGVPLHAEDEAGRRELDRLDDPVGGGRRRDQPAAEVTDGLVVRAAHRGRLAEDAGGDGARHGLDVEVGEDEGGAAVRQVPDDVGQVLVQGAPQLHVEDLAAPADGEHRHVGPQRGGEEGALAGVPVLVDAGHLGRRLLVVGQRVDVAATGEDEAVEDIYDLVRARARGRPGPCSGAAGAGAGPRPPPPARNRTRAGRRTGAPRCPSGRRPRRWRRR